MSLPQPVPAAQGRLDLTLSLSGGKTILSRQDGHSPLHVQGVLHGEVCAAEVVLLNVAGMILGGDHHDLRVEVLAGGHARLRTIGATRVHRAEPAAPARSRIALHVGPGALLEYLPGALLPHAGAWFEQETILDLAPGGHTLMAELLAPGRLHAGEAFAYRRLALSFSACCAASPLLSDTLILEPDAWPFGHAALFGPSTHLATLYAVGPRADAALADELHATIQQAGACGGASTGYRDAVVARILGHSAHVLSETVQVIAAMCRDRFLAGTCSARR
jgi:urease accessory protein